jgi:DNA-binding beta-propeller fold protein YncE
MGGLSTPEGLVLDHQGHLYVVNRGNAGIGVLNVRSPVDDTHAFHTLTLPHVWSLNQPRGIALDGKDRLYIADSGDRRILVLSRRGRPVRSLAGPPGSALFDPTGLAIGPEWQLYVTDTLGSCVDSADTSRRSPALHQISCARLHAPGGIAADNRGRLFVADTGHSRILVLDNGRSHV